MYGKAVTCLMSTFLGASAKPSPNMDEILFQTDMSLLYATKIWTWNESSTAEPFVGTSVLGREMYWAVAFKDFENLAKVGWSRDVLMI